MAMDTVTFALQGDSVSLEQFADAVGRFSRIVTQLSAHAGAPNIGWEIENLEVGSATTTARAASLNGYSAEQVEAVINSYLEVGQALQHGDTIPYPKPLQKEAKGLLTLLGDGIEAIRFETPEAEAIVGPRPDQIVATEAPSFEVRPAYGAVTGRIQTVTSRSRLKFTIYDRLYDKPVSCYLLEGSEDMMRDAWDRIAIVEGIVSRDPLSGRPLSVRKIRSVDIVEEGQPTDYKAARGALPCGENLRAEHRLRSVRDAW